MTSILNLEIWEEKRYPEGEREVVFTRISQDLFEFLYRWRSSNYPIESDLIQTLIECSTYEWDLWYGFTWEIIFGHQYVYMKINHKLMSQDIRECLYNKPGKITKYLGECTRKQIEDFLSVYQIPTEVLFESNSNSTQENPL